MEHGDRHAAGTGRIRPAANLFCRGWIEPAYFHQDSDYRQGAGDSYTLTCMAQLGGWAVLDHALCDAADPYPVIRLGYASYLSAFAPMNSGTAASGYGYRYPGEVHDGAAGGGFEPAPTGTTWLEQPHTRGSWYYSCEIDLGFCGALRRARTVLADDSIFGWTCPGGDSMPSGAGVAIIPCDGQRQRIHLRLADTTLDLELSGGRFAAGVPVVVGRGGRHIGFDVEPTADTSLRITGLAAGRYRAAFDDGREELVDVTRPIGVPSDATSLSIVGETGPACLS